MTLPHPVIRTHGVTATKTQLKEADLAAELALESLAYFLSNIWELNIIHARVMAGVQLKWILVEIFNGGVDVMIPATQEKKMRLLQEASIHCLLENSRSYFMIQY